MSIKIITLSIEYRVEFFAIGDVDPARSAVEFWQRTQLFFLRLLSGVKKKAQPRFHQLRHRAPLPDRFPPEPGHHGIINVEGGLYMESHTSYMAICQRTPILASSGQPK